MPEPLTLQALPEDFPVFPLPRALLLPGGQLPLNIFEPRYLAMVEDALGEKRIFGMVQPDKRLAAGDTGPGLYRTGCLGKVTAFSETEDGRYLITLAGLIRYTIVEEIEPRHGYRRVRGATAGFAADLQPPEAELPFGRAALLSALRQYFARQGADANWESIGLMDDATLVTSLSMACPFDAEEKQALLEAKSPAERAQALLALLQIHGFDSGGDSDVKAS